MNLAKWLDHGTGHRVIEVDLIDPEQHHTFVVVRYGEHAMVLDLMMMTGPDHLCVDAHGFEGPNHEQATVGVFGLSEGIRYAFGAPAEPTTTSRGWPSASLVALVVGEQDLA